jgi:uncharacterized protein YbjT (DUF2867 family)
VSSALYQPIASDDVVAALADVTVSPAVNGIVEVAGPERISMAEMVKRYLIAMGDSRNVVADPNTPYFGAVLNDGSLTPAPGSNPRIGSKTFEVWFSETKQRV